MTLKVQLVNVQLVNALLQKTYLYNLLCVLVCFNF